MPTSYLTFCHLLLLLPSIFSSIRVFSKLTLKWSVLHVRRLKYWTFSLNISPSNEHPGLISFRMDWCDLLAVQGTLKSLLQHHSSKASILQRSAFFIVQLSHLYMTTGKTIALTRWTFVGKEYLCFWICCLGWSYIFFQLKEQMSFNFMTEVSICSDFGAQENKVSHCFHYFPIYLPWIDGTRCHYLCFLNAEFSANFFTLLFHFH